MAIVDTPEKWPWKWEMEYGLDGAIDRPLQVLGYLEFFKEWSIIFKTGLHACPFPTMERGE